MQIAISNLFFKLLIFLDYNAFLNNFVLRFMCPKVMVDIQVADVVTKAVMVLDMMQL